MEIANAVVLALSGLMLTLVGALRLAKPIKSYCLQTYRLSPGANAEEDVDMMSEMRGAGAATMVAGMVILAGAAMPAMRPTSFAVAVVIFLGFGLGRAVSWSSDGKPNKDLVNGTISEFVLGGLNLACLLILLA